VNLIIDMGIVQVFLLLAILVPHPWPCQSEARPGRSTKSRSNGLNNEISIGRKVSCPKVRFRRRGCTSKYECKEECVEKKKCKTTYEYKCKDYRRQECKNVWQNQCNGKGKGRRRRSSERSRRRPYWLNTEIIYDTQNYPLPASDIPFASPVQGQVFQFASQPKSRRCWQKVRQCKWKTYKSSCGNIPTKTCEDKKVKECKRKCKNRYYCDKCPNKKPKPKPPTKPVGPRPTQRPRPSTTRPSRPGPPAIPPPGTFIGPPGVSPPKKDSGLSIIDV